MQTTINNLNNQLEQYQKQQQQDVITIADLTRQRDESIEKYKESRLKNMQLTDENIELLKDIGNRIDDDSLWSTLKDRVVEMNETIDSAYNLPSVEEDLKAKAIEIETLKTENDNLRKQLKDARSRVSTIYLRNKAKK